MKPKGKLILIPCSLGENAVEQSVVPALRSVINSLDIFIVENEKSARKFLKEVGISKQQSSLTMLDYGKHSREGNPDQFLEPIYESQNIGLLSEAGCPAVADPGSDIVAAAHRSGIQVVPFVGPSSIMLALMASGFNGQGFAFNGYLPIDKAQRAKKLKDLESLSQRTGQTQIFIETPFRNHQLLEDIIKCCNTATMLCMACDLTLPNEFIKTQSIADWKKQQATINIHKRPTVFLLHKY